MRRPAQPVAAWWLLAAGAVLLAGSLTLARHWRAERQEASLQEQALLEARQALMKPVTASSPTATQRRWIQARPELNKPWKAALGAIESATREPIYLLSMSIDPTTGIIRLEGEAPGFDEALAYVQALGAESALSSATLESHTEISGAAGSGPAAALPTQFPAAAPPASRPPVRFSALAHWRLP